jgi:hypothetical protein
MWFLKRWWKKWREGRKCTCQGYSSAIPSLSPLGSIYFSYDLPSDQQEVCSRRAESKKKSAQSMAMKFFAEKLYLDPLGKIYRDDLIREWNRWKKIPGNIEGYHQIHNECSQVLAGLRYIFGDMIKARRIMTNGTDKIYYRGISLK